MNNAPEMWALGNMELFLKGRWDLDFIGSFGVFILYLLHRPCWASLPPSESSSQTQGHKDSGLQ